MKKFLSFTFLISIIANVALFAEPRHFPSTVTEVTVYLRGAMVKRVAHINLQQGNNEIILDGLSNSLDINSVRLESTSNITILSVNASNNYLKQDKKSADEIQLSTNLDTLNQRLSRTQNEIGTMNEEMDMLKQNYKVTIGAQGFYADALENTADFYAHRVKDILNDLTILKGEEKNLMDKIAAIEAQLNEIQHKNGTPHGEITVTASSPGYSDADFIFSYYVNEAGWAPTYNIRAENDSSDIALDYDAEVYQTSGEDWNNVSLILSTGDPSVSGIKPKLTTNLLDFEAPDRVYFAPSAPRSESVSGSSINNSAMSMDKTSSKENSGNNEGYVSNYTNANQNILATTFNIDLKYTILSDGIVKHIRIQQDTLHTQFSYSAIPKLSTYAFLEADITGWEPYNLLPGDVNIFLQNSFVGKSYINPSTTGDTLTVSFGKDNKINIKRTRVKDFTRSQFLGNSRIQSFGYNISARNTRSRPIAIKIEDQIPVSSEKDIEVQLLQSSGAELDQSTGTLTWRIALQPNNEKDIPFEYTVKYPKGKKINL